ncbi:MAG: GNAT family N-acetyltransferase [Candidatus Komeilibacteria bacterium]|nr:GNAT family N-acetyltransferase [Candidatus Komeilibacteria bacterium]
MKERFGESLPQDSVSLENQESLSPLERELLALKGASFEELPAENPEGLRTCLLKVNNREEWESPEERQRLISIFGKLAFDAGESPSNFRQYNPNEDASLAQADESVETNLQPADKIFFIADREKPLGFLSTEGWGLKDGTQARYVHLLSVDHSQQNKGHSRELYRLAFEQADVSAFVGISFRPQAVKNRLKIGEEFDYSGFFAGYKNGEWGNRGTAEEQARVKELSALMVEKSKEWDILAERKTPEGYVIWQGEKTLPPLREGEVNFNSNDPLDKTFREGVLKLQSECEPDVAHGILINLKKENN